MCDYCEAIPRNDLYINIAGECEATFVEIPVKKPGKNVIIGSVYNFFFFYIFLVPLKKVKCKNDLGKSQFNTNLRNIGVHTIVL